MLTGSLVAALLGGVGLFLLGMHLMTEGLRLAAGGALRRMLLRWTGTRTRAVASGALLTAVVQSSSAVTLAAIGFVNAGLVTLSQGVAVIFGSNVGTTVTGWLVAVIGFHVDLKAFALPMIGIGMVLRLVGARRFGPLSEALAGFGIFFLGIDVLKSALAGSDALGLVHLDVEGAVAALAFIGVGVLLTVITQSSSAAIAIILTSVGSGALAIEPGACLVIGTNVGTTSTAVIAVMGATSNAKRAAAAHVVFNVATAAAALALLPLLLYAVSELRRVLHLDAEPAAVVAGFHTVFNLLGVALMWPVFDRLVGWLERHFRTPEEDEARPRYLDRTLVATPGLAVGALGMELARIARIAREMSEHALGAASRAEHLAARRAVVDALVTAVGDFTTGVQRARLPAGLDAALPTALRIARHFAEVAELAEAVAASRAELPALDSDLARVVRECEDALRALLTVTAVEAPESGPEDADLCLQDFEFRYRKAKDTLLDAGAAGRIPVHGLVLHLDRLSNLRRLAQQAVRGAVHLWRLGDLASGADVGEAEGEFVAQAIAPAPQALGVRREKTGDRDAAKRSA